MTASISRHSARRPWASSSSGATGSSATGFGAWESALKLNEPLVKRRRSKSPSTNVGA